MRSINRIMKSCSTYLSANFAQRGHWIRRTSMLDGGFGLLGVVVDDLVVDLVVGPWRMW